MMLNASFVIAAYNAERYLAETIDSCINQTMRRIEIIVVDDGSTDSTWKVIEHFMGRDERVRGVMLATNVGRSMARNKGIEEAKSDIVMILDADDIALPQRAQLTCAHFRKNASDLAYGQFARIDALGNRLDVYDALPFDWDKVKSTGFTYICHSTVAFKKSVFAKVQYTDGEFSKHGIDDWKFQVDAYRAGLALAPINKPLALYRYIVKKRDEHAITEIKATCLSAN